MSNDLFDIAEFDDCQGRVTRLSVEGLGDTVQLSISGRRVELNADQTDALLATLAVIAPR